MEGIIERRIHERGKVEAIAIVWIEERGPVRYVVRDLSAGGAFLTAGPDLPVRTKVTMTLQIVGASLLDLEGEVVRHSSWRVPAMGVAFRNVSAGDEDIIQQAVLGALEEHCRGECPSRRVLVVDDSEAICTTLQKELTSLGHQVVWARSAEEAHVKMVDPYARYDVAIVDRAVGAEQGVELLGKVAGLHPGVRRVLMSVPLTPDDLALAEMTGKADVLLPKPWTRQALLAVMRV